MQIQEQQQRYFCDSLQRNQKTGFVALARHGDLYSVMKMLAGQLTTKCNRKTFNPSYRLRTRVFIGTSVGSNNRSQFSVICRQYRNVLGAAQSISAQPMSE